MPVDLIDRPTTRLILPFYFRQSNQSSPPPPRAITVLCTHPMRPAEYMAAGTHDAWRHYGTYGRCAKPPSSPCLLASLVLGSAKPDRCLSKRFIARSHKQTNTDSVGHPVLHALHVTHPSVRRSFWRPRACFCLPWGWCPVSIE